MQGGGHRLDFSGKLVYFIYTKSIDNIEYSLYNVKVT